MPSVSQSKTIMNQLKPKSKKPWKSYKTMPEMQESNSLAKILKTQIIQAIKTK